MQDLYVYLVCRIPNDEDSLDGLPVTVLGLYYTEQEAVDLYFRLRAELSTANNVLRLSRRKHTGGFRAGYNYTFESSLIKAAKAHLILDPNLPGYWLGEGRYATYYVLRATEGWSKDSVRLKVKGKNPYLSKVK